CSAWMAPGLTDRLDLFTQTPHQPPVLPPAMHRHPVCPCLALIIVRLVLRPFNPHDSDWAGVLAACRIACTHRGAHAHRSGSPCFAYSRSGDWRATTVPPRPGLASSSSTTKS